MVLDAKVEGRRAKSGRPKPATVQLMPLFSLGALLFALRPLPFAEFLKCCFSAYSANPHVISIASPVMLLPSFDARKTTAAATCAGSTIRFSAVPSR